MDHFIWIVVLIVAGIVIVISLTHRKNVQTPEIIQIQGPAEKNDSVRTKAESRKEAEQLYKLAIRLEKLKGYDVYVKLFMEYARAFQVLFGIEREFQEDEPFLLKIEREFMNLFRTDILTEQGFQLEVPAIVVDKESFLEKTETLNAEERKEELRLVQAEIKDRENREDYKAIMEGTGPLLYDIIQKKGDKSQASVLREDIGRVAQIFRVHGIYPMFYEDFSQGDSHLWEFEKSNRYASAYPGLYRKDGSEYNLLNECCGRRGVG